MRVIFPVSFKRNLSFRSLDQKREDSVEKKSSKSKKKKLYEEVMKKARAENATLNNELYEMLKAQGYVLLTMLKKY